MKTVAQAIFAHLVAGAGLVIVGLGAVTDDANALTIGIFGCTFALWLMYLAGADGRRA